MPKGGGFIIPSNALPDVFTVDQLSDEQRQIQATARRFMAEWILHKDISDQIEGKDFILVRALMNNLADLGLLGVEIPEEYGGGELDKISSTVLSEEIGKQGSFAVSVLVHKGIGTWPIVLFGTPEQKQKYLPRLANGTLIAAYCLTESGAGSDANAARTTAVLGHNDQDDTDGYLLNGEKIFVSNGGFADLFIVFAKLDGKLTAFIVEKSFLGVQVAKEEHKMGICGSSTATIVLENVFVSKANLLGEAGKGFKIAMNVLNLGRFGLGTACLGAGRLCLEEASRYARDRKQFGQPIGNFGLVKEKLAGMTVRVYAMEGVVYRTAQLLEFAFSQASVEEDKESVLKAIREFATECSLVKVYCSEALDWIVDENVQVHGGSGFCEELPPARHYRDSRINRIFEGTNEINRLFAVSELLKRAKDLGLPAVIAGIVNEAMTPNSQEEPDELVEQLLLALNGARKCTLLAGGTISQKFPQEEDLFQHQFILGQLCDCVIDTYVMESALAVLAKTGQGTVTCKSEAMTRLLFAEKLPAIENRVKNILACCVEGEDLRMRLAMVKRLLKIVPENIEFLHNKILES